MSSIGDYISASIGQPRMSGGFVQGVVTENADKKFPGMVKVEFTGWEDQKNIYDWVPLLHRSAGKDYGDFDIPEIGDLVLVGFIGPGYQRPFVMGCFYPANAKYPGKSFQEKNFTKAMRTKGGVELTVSDEKEKQSFELKTPKELTLRFEDEKEIISIADKQGQNLLRLDCKNGKLQIEAKTAITMKAGKCEIKLDANSGQLSIKCAQLEIKADQTAKLSGGQMMTIEGGVLKIEGKQTAALKGGAMTEISGGMLKLN